MQGNTVSVFCPHCHERTALLQARTSNNGPPAVWIPPGPPGPFWWIGICNGCQKPCLVGGNGTIVYPAPSPSPTDPNIPEPLRRDLDEAKMCFSVQCYRACAAMARRTVQQACISKLCKSRDLVQQIAELTQAGHITKDIEEWATVVRWIGNDAAHPNGDQVAKEDAEDCLRLAEQFLHVLFVTPAIAKARRALRGK